jgi:hypothetical protein
VSFGILAAPIMGTIAPIVMSVVAFAAGAQFAAVGVLAAGGGPFAAAADGSTAPRRHPEWIRARIPTGENYHDLKRIVRGLTLNTVCEEAHCPNIGECWEQRTATIMILGDVCTRACGFCAVTTGRPTWNDEDEPRRVAEAIAEMRLEHVVVTSVARDDLPDGGAHIFAETIRALRTEIAELAADAEAQLPEGTTYNVPIVTETQLPFLPDTLGPRELLHVEKSLKRGIAAQLLAATESLGPLAERLAGFDDEECRALAERVAAFVVAVRGAGPGPAPG